MELHIISKLTCNSLHQTQFLPEKNYILRDGNKSVGLITIVRKATDEIITNFYLKKPV